MKRLALLRHAKSSWDDPALADFDRPLNKRGVKAARAMGAEMRRRGLQFDLVLASPARRVVETLEEVERGYGGPLEPRFDGRIYDSSAMTLLEILRSAHASVARLLIIGHNPELHELAVVLADRSEPLRESVARRYPTAALALLELPVERWEEVEPGTARIADFVRPKELSGH